MTAFSWSIILDGEKGILIAHQRPNNIINVWIAGIVNEERKNGLFKHLVKGLLSIVKWNTKITMTTRSKQFRVMYDILSKVATMSDGHGRQTSDGKDRFEIYGCELWFFYHRGNNNICHTNNYSVLFHTPLMSSYVFHFFVMLINTKE